VIIVGAGPTGLMLAGDLAAAGARTVVLDRAYHPNETPKGNGVVGLAVRELRRRKLLRGTGLRVVRPARYGFGPLSLEFGLLRRPLELIPVPQRRLEGLLAEYATRLGATLLRGHEVLDFEQDGDGVTVHAMPATADAAGSDLQLRGRYLVGCDGAHSLVRKRLGIAFPGTTSPFLSRIARITIPAHAVPRLGNRIVLPGVGPQEMFRPIRTGQGTVTIAPAQTLDPSAPDDLYIVNTHEPRGEAEPTDRLEEAELRASLRRVLGADLPFTSAHAARSLVGNNRQAERYREGRVFIAGDAAHVYGAGGTGINSGLLDAVALGRRLADVLAGRAPADALDTYEAQRHPAGRRHIGLARLQTAMAATDENGDELRELVGDLLRDRGTARRIAGLIAG
jgi:2-polyprenyl-6-methoxyphenol hydroxylase-like FAD-dependent oxidoreductase